MAELEPYRLADPAASTPGPPWRARATGGPGPDAAHSRWNAGRDLSWEPLRPDLVCEVAYDHLQGQRFRHATSFKRWRPDREAASCTFAQLDTPVPVALAEVFGQ